MSTNKTEVESKAGARKEKEQEEEDLNDPKHSPLTAGSEPRELTDEEKAAIKAANERQTAQIQERVNRAEAAADTQRQQLDRGATLPGYEHIVEEMNDEAAEARGEKREKSDKSSRAKK